MRDHEREGDLPRDDVAVEAAQAQQGLLPEGHMALLEAVSLMPSRDWM